jgi:NADPH-dependent glutamate synthase beta subunit-like oxidoreductase/ferredoxin
MSGPVLPIVPSDRPASGPVRPTDQSDPNYFHRVVDCQWACPAHTDVPGYIRLIAQGRFTDAYMLNRESNVFPAILGRTCDRPCEPACRRGRVEDEPVAICRLKRVAADLRDDEEVRSRLPAVPEVKNGHRIACVGAGPASLTVANDLLPLGYEVTVFEKVDRVGGLMWSNIPRFRLPPRVLEEEIGMIVDMGVDLRLNTPVASMKSLLDEGWDAVFIGTGAPKGKNLKLPGRYDAEPIHIGIDWLASVAFGHVTTIEPRVLVIGVGNTAMDCCRTAKRLGGTDVKVMARKPRAYFKASPWELEDAEGEGIEIVEDHSPTRFVIEDGVLTGMEFQRFRSTLDAEGELHQELIDTVVIPCDAVILAIGQDNAFPWIERDIGIEFDAWDVPVVDKVTFETTRAGVFCGGDAAWGPENIIWAVEHGHQAAISIHQRCQGLPLTERPAYGMNLVSQKMGLKEWSYSNAYDESERASMRMADLAARLEALEVEAELGFDLQQTLKEVERCLNCDIQTYFTAEFCIECDACIDVCPLSCLTMTPNAPEYELRQELTVPAFNLSQPLFVSEGLQQTGRVMVKDEDLCIHCGLCAERCPTAAWDMRRSELLIPYAGLEAGQAHARRATHART